MTNGWLIFSVNALISVFVAWTYMIGGPVIFGSIGFFFLVCNVIFHLIVLMSTAYGKSPIGIKRVTKIMIETVGASEINGGAFVRFLNTAMGFISSLFTGSIFVASGFSLIGFSYIALAGWTMWSVASMDDMIREFAKNPKKY